VRQFAQQGHVALQIAVLVYMWGDMLMADLYCRYFKYICKNSSIILY